MAALRARYLIGGLIIMGAIGYLAFAANSDSWAYYQDVDTFVGKSPKVGARARVHGRIAADGADIRPVDLFARFELIGDQRRLAVEYRGAVPNLLAAGGQVVAEGTLDASGVFQADQLLTKCASKYEGHGQEMIGGGSTRP